MKKLSKWIVMLVMAVLVLSACSPKAAEPGDEIQPGTPQGVFAEGRLLPASTLAHSFSVPGKVTEVLVKDGDLVTRGQILARLAYSPEAEAALTRAQLEELTAQQAFDSLINTADLNQAQTQLAYLDAKENAEDGEADFAADGSEKNKFRLDAARAALAIAENDVKKLENSGGVDPEQMAAAQARLTSAKAAAASAQAYIDALTLTAEIDGTVTGLSIQAGEQAAAGMPALVIADFTNWIVETENLTEMEVVDIEPGQRVEVLLDALPDVTLTGEVAHISSRYEEKRGDITYTVTIRLNQFDPQMRWGMTAAIRFIQ